MVVSVLARDTVPNCKIKFIDEVINNHYPSTYSVIFNDHLR